MGKLERAKQMASEFKGRASKVQLLLGEKGLGLTGQGYVEEWLTARWCGYQKEFSNKYTRKGIRHEDEAIELVKRVRDIGEIVKCTESKANDWITGACDLLLPKGVDDVKCSWDAFTFPKWKKTLDNKVYISQGKSYLWLYDKEVFNVHYVLVDASQEEVEEQYWYAHRDNKIGGDEVNDKLYEEVRAKMIHSHLPEEQRVKTFTIERDAKFEALVPERVQLGRDHVLTLLTS